MTSHASKPPLVFYRTGPMPCPYLPGRAERNLFTELRSTMSQEQHDTLTKAGFRRSHHIVYRPACPGCNACVPVRIVAADFTPARWQRRIIRRNEDLTVRSLASVASDEHYEVFTRYQQARHLGGEMAAMTFSDFRAMVEDTVVDTELLEFRDSEHRLIGACLLDRLSDGLSAVYSYFDPADGGRSMGSYMILQLIANARKDGLRHIYLGYWISSSSKMSYKLRFQPIEALGSDGWKRCDDTGQPTGSD